MTGFSELGLETMRCFPGHDEGIESAFGCKAANHKTSPCFRMKWWFFKGWRMTANGVPAEGVSSLSCASGIPDGAQPNVAGLVERIILFARNRTVRGAAAALRRVAPKA